MPDIPVSLSPVIIGADGKSAYQLWVAAGNTGTVQDFLDSLKSDGGVPVKPFSALSTTWLPADHVNELVIVTFTNGNFPVLALADAANWRTNGVIVSEGSVSPTAVTISPKTVSGNVGGTQQLTSVVLPSNTTNASVIYASSNTAIATVNSSGLVSFIAVGAAVITVTTSVGGFTDTSSITVNAAIIQPTSVTVDPMTFSLTVGSTQQMTPTVLPANATTKSVSWVSSDTTKATVNSSGLVTAVAAGSATITATTINGLTASSVATITAVQVGTVFTMTQLAEPNKIYQRSSITGGSANKGAGVIPVSVNVTQAGSIRARVRSSDGTTIG